MSMNNSQSTSFIPQRPTKGKVGARGVRKIYVLTYISYVLFCGALFAAGATFFYNLTVQNQLDETKQALAAERENFNQADIESVRELDKRIAVARERMNNHISVLSIFEALEQSAVQALRFTRFDYKRAQDDAPVVTITGSTGRFDTVAFQRDVLSVNPVLANSSITEIGLQAVDTDSGEAENFEQVITFALEKTVEPSVVPYVPRVNSGAVTQVTQQESEQSTDADEDSQSQDSAEQTQESDSDVADESEGEEEQEEAITDEPQ